MENITVVVVDDVVDIRENVRKLLNFETDIAIVGEAGTGDEAIDVIQKLRPHIVLMDINMPGMDGITATEIISIKFPTAAVVMISVQEDQEYLRKAMMAGARDFLVKPFSSEDLVGTIRRVHEKQKQLMQFSVPPSQGADDTPSLGRIITFFSTKGGTGKTTLAVNTAVALAELTGKKVCLLDLDLQFGDVAILLNLKMASTIAELVEQSGEVLDPQDVMAYLQKHSSNVMALLSCPKPYLAETITIDHIKQIIAVLREEHDYVIIDTSTAFRDIELTALDMADLVMTVVTLELSAIKSVKLSLEVMEDMLRYSKDKIKVILNRESPTFGIAAKDVTALLKHELIVRIPDEAVIVTSALNRGLPFFISDDRSAPVMKSIVALAHAVMTPEDSGVFLSRAENDGGFMGKLKGFLKR
ncbi:MAG: hypothetical protein CVV64_08460 [Candidatus Wallbacteria bacterium HGW-Wallbacteria-1]|uniref:Response regulatory domain-containing protein n=1 Tax=Candidatus Wallbacteria bacterium HGW-Wallbacteria-1 TaxID=2013854 RepID=A0A2N1PPX6_9BACT|nr:MAG: hypothetical protein CVV64_08460 [Candidatus Wallbacteria bacterium HGW-Wallbacteria-1]